VGGDEVLNKDEEWDGVSVGACFSTSFHKKNVGEQFTVLVGDALR
jgi:hypothetical protein